MCKKINIFFSDFIVLGVGFSSKTQGKQGEYFIAQQMERLSISRISAIATRDKIFIPPFLRIWAKQLGSIPILSFSSTYLERQSFISSSRFVYNSVGCHSVAEAAALAASGSNAFLILKKTVFNNMTFAIAGTKQ